MDAINEIRLLVLEAIVQFYERAKDNLHYDQYKRESRNAVEVVEALPPPLTSGPLLVSYRQYLGDERLARLVRDVSRCFNLWLTGHYRPSFVDDNDLSRAALKAEERALEEAMGEADYALSLAFRDTILFPYFKQLLKAVDVEVPYQFPDHLRFRGHLIAGYHGTGKTTYLSNLIMADIERVKRGECAVVVMDSQETLIPQLSRLKVFAPGGELAGKLVYIEPDEEHPIAVNILDTEANRSALQLINFFMKSVSESSTSSHMDTILAHVVPAVMTIPNATIFTLQQFMLKGYKAFENQLDVPPDEHEWLAARLGAPEYKMTIGALNARLDAFTSDPFFKRMFSPAKSRFDLHQELKSPKVILINTSKIRLRDATADFGRFWIAKLLQAVEGRMLEKEKLPVFAYIDEAEEYIRNEANIEEIVDRARKQNLALTVAIKEESQITSSGVLAALRRMPIKTQLHQPGRANVVVNGQELSLSVPKMDLTREPTMSHSQWHQVLSQMHERYCVPVSRYAAPVEDRVADPAQPRERLVVREIAAEIIPPKPKSLPPPKDDDDIRPIKDW